MALGAAVLPDQLARPPLRRLEHPLEVLDGAAPAGPGSPVPPDTVRATTEQIRDLLRREVLDGSPATGG